MTPDTAREHILANRKAWASARQSAAPLEGEAATNLDVLDQLVIWRMNDPRYVTRETKLRGLTMQRQWTIEARADYADQEKNDAITKAIREAAVHVHAVMSLLADGQKPQVVCFSDDFFHGHEQIALHEDVMGKAVQDHGDNMGEGKVSDELLAAAAEIMHDQNEAKAK